jgi:hypothetical protein
VNATFVEWTVTPALPSFAAMTAGARTPEELEMLFEDAFVVRDRGEFCTLFGDGAVFAPGEAGEARGAEAIAAAAAELWASGRTYAGGARRVLQARDTALVIAPTGIHVARRAADRTWRVAISLLNLTTSEQEDA